VVLHDVLAQVLEERDKAAGPLDRLRVPAGAGSRRRERRRREVETRRRRRRDGTHDSLCSLMTRLTQNMALSLNSPT